MRHGACPDLLYFLTDRGPTALGLALALLVILSSPSSVRAQDPEIEWTVSVGTQDFDEVLAASAQASGVYVVGSTGGTFPSSQSSGGGSDAFISKYDADGEEAWTRQFGTSGADRATSVVADSSAVYIAGSTTGTFSGQSNSGNNSDAFIRKYTLQGSSRWTRQFGTNGADEARALDLDSSGLYVAGVVGGPAAGYSPGSGSDAFIRKYDRDGELVWEQQFGTSGSQEVFGLAVDTSGVYVAGTTSSAMADQEYVGGATDVFIRKYDAMGNEVWTRLAGTPGLDQPAGIAVGSSRGYIAGTTTSSFPGEGSYGGARDVFLIIYDFEGAELSIRQFGTAGSDEAAGVVAVGRDVFITGSTSGALPGYTNTGDNLDGFLVTYNTRGRKTWETQLGTSGVDRPLGITTYQDLLYIVGNVEGDFPSESDGFITSLVLPGVEQPGPGPLAPTPTLSPTATPSPTLVATPSPTPTQRPAATPTAAPTATPIPLPTATATPLPPPTATATPLPTALPTPTPTSIPSPTPGPAATLAPTPTPLVFPLPDNSAPPVSVQILVLGVIGVLAVIALIGVVRNW